MANTLSQQDVAMVVGGLALLWWFTSGSGSGEKILDLTGEEGGDEDPDEEMPEASEQEDFGSGRVGGGEPKIVIGPSGEVGEVGLKGGGDKGSGGRTHYHAHGPYDKRPRGGGRGQPPAAASATANRSTTTGGHTGNWARANMPRPRTAQAAINKMYGIGQKAERLSGTRLPFAKQVLRGEHDSNARGAYKQLTAILQEARVMTAEYDTLYDTLDTSARGDAAQRMHRIVDPFVATCEAAVRYLEKTFTRFDTARETQIKMLTAQKGLDKVRRRKQHEKDRQETSALRDQLRRTQLAQVNASAASNAKISDLRDELRRAQDETMVLREEEALVSFESDRGGGFRGADIIGIGGGTMSRPNSKERMENWAHRFSSEQQSDVSTATGMVVDNRANTALAPIDDEPMMDFLPPVHATSHRSKSEVEVTNTRTKVSGALHEARNVQVVNQIGGRLRDMRSNVAEVTRGASVIGSENTTMGNLFNSASVDPDRTSASNTDSARAEVLASQDKHHNRPKSSSSRLKVLTKPKIGNGFQSAPKTLIGDTKVSIPVGKVGQPPVRPPVQPSPITNAFNTQPDKPQHRRRRKSKAPVELPTPKPAYQKQLESALQVVTNTAAGQKLGEMDRLVERLKALQPERVSPGQYAAKRARGDKTGSDSYLLWSDALDRAQRLARDAHAVGVAQDRAHRKGHPSRKGSDIQPDQRRAKRTKTAKAPPKPRHGVQSPRGRTAFVMPPPLPDVRLQRDSPMDTLAYGEALGDKRVFEQLGADVQLRRSKEAKKRSGFGPARQRHEEQEHEHQQPVGD